MNTRQASARKYRANGRWVDSPTKATDAGLQTTIKLLVDGDSDASSSVEGFREELSVARKVAGLAIHGATRVR